jgi:hypothetical protein
MFLLFANVAESQIYIILLLLWLLLCFMNFLVLFVIKYFSVIEIPTFIG